MNEPINRGPTFALVWMILTVALLLGLAADLIPHLDPLVRSKSLEAASASAAADVVSSCSRTLGVSLSMLVALCALAIPLTANVYTPKLIELFVADRVNRAVISYFVLANAVVLWNSFMIDMLGTDSGARSRAFVSLSLTIAGLLCIAPYFLYVLRFLVPRTIVTRIRSEVITSLDELTDKEVVSAADQIDAIRRAVTNVQYLGKVTLRSIQRHDRDVASEGLRALEYVFQAYQTRKSYIPDEALSHSCRDALGLSPELALEVERKHAVIEVAILQELALLLPIAIQTELSEVVSQIAALTRTLAVRVAERGDADAAEMVMLHFNTFLRVSLKTKSADAFYKLVYHYRRFAEEVLLYAPQLSERVAFFLDYYAHQAVRMRMPFLLNVVAYDLAGLTEAAWVQGVEARDRLLDRFIELDRDEPGILDMPGMVKAQIILAAKLATRNDVAAAALLEDELRKVPVEVLQETFGHIVATREEHFWEIADRRRHLDHVEPEFRAAVRSLRLRLVGETNPGLDTLLFHGARPSQLPLPTRKGTGRSLPPASGAPTTAPASRPAAEAASAPEIEPGAPAEDEGREPQPEPPDPVPDATADGAEADAHASAEEEAAAEEGAALASDLRSGAEAPKSGAGDGS